MLDTIERTYAETKGIYTVKAPANHMFIVKGFLITNRASDSNELIISRAAVEEDMDVLTSEKDVMFMHSLAIAGETATLYLEDGIKAKYITFGPRVDSNINCIAIVYYKLEKASINDLILEFIARGKSP